jgi:hypothetical protein
MNTRRALPLLSLAVLAAACDPPVAPRAEDGAAAVPPVSAYAATSVQAAGTFTQTGITSLVPSSAGPNTILEQTSVGVLSGTLSGPWEDRLRVVIHPNGRFNAKFVITCACTVDGRSGTLTIQAQDAGELVSPDLGAFEGSAVIVAATGDLAGLRGVLRIEGTVDVTTGLSTYGYSGVVHFAP